jgi:aspartate-semialdehyde dehydrogenase
VFLENGYTKEEMKMVNETCKIMGDDTIKVTATCVRIPVIGGHSESINITFEKDFDLQELREHLRAAPGVVLQDSPDANLYPMPLTAHQKDEVFVGRIRRDESLPNSVNLWVVADNLRKGAATNAIQIAEYLVKQQFVA